VGENRKQRAIEKIASLSAEPQSLVTFWSEASEVLKTAIPYYSYPCWYTLDPASLLITSHYNPYMPTFPAESLALEYYGDDVNKIVDVARSESGVSTLHDATGGDPRSSPRWQANIEMGGDQEMVAALRTRTGESWVPSVCTESRANRCSTRQTSASCSTLLPTWLTAPDARSSSVRRLSPRHHTRPDYSCSPRTGRSSPRLRA